MCGLILTSEPDGPSRQTIVHWSVRLFSPNNTYSTTSRLKLASMIKNRRFVGAGRHAAAFAGQRRVTRFGNTGASSAFTLLHLQHIGIGSVSLRRNR
jgi:hypothetical protein